MPKEINLDVYSDFFKKTSAEFPKLATWENPEFKEQRKRVLRSEEEMRNFFDWLYGKYPDIIVKLDWFQ